LLALAAGAIGVAAAAAAIRVVRARAPVNIPRLAEVGIDPTVLGVALGTAVAVALVLGLLPAVRRRGDPGDALREGGRRSTAGRRRLRGRNVLVATQVALALVLLIGSGLLFRTYGELRAVDLGFEQRRAVVFELGLPDVDYPTRADARRLHGEVLDRLGAFPGVEAVGAVGPCLPLSGDMCWGETLEAEGRPIAEGRAAAVTGTRVVTADYFRTLGIPVRGRVFDAVDETSGSRVAILSESAAEAYFGSEDPVGERVRFGSDGPWHRVVGVAGDVRGRVETDEFRRLIYLPLRPESEDGPPLSTMAYVVATDVSPTSIVPAVHRAVGELDPALPLSGVGRLEDLIDRATAPTAFALALIGIAAIMALLLGAVGVYGVVAYAVSRRTAEIGVRMALGARGVDVRRMVVRQGGAAVLAGAAFGLAAAAFATRALSGMLYGVAPIDPATYLLLTALMLLVAGAALWLPAARAARVQPVDALRAD
ncbi:MAG: ABC transporter permease, partial [Gemmatimonadota bacterium]